MSVAEILSSKIVAVKLFTGWTTFMPPNQQHRHTATTYQLQVYSVSQTPLKFSDIFPKRLGIFSPNFVRLLYVPIYAGLQTFIQLPATLTKLCHTKCDHHHMLKMSTIALNMA